MQIDVGTQIPAWRIESVDAEKMKTMAVLLRDPNRIHWDVEAVKNLGMGDRPVNQGPNNMAYVINALIEWLGDATKIRSVNVRFQANVFAQDTLTASGRVTAIHVENGERFADCDVWLDREDGYRVLTGKARIAIP